MSHLQNEQTKYSTLSVFFTGYFIFFFVCFVVIVVVVVVVCLLSLIWVLLCSLESIDGDVVDDEKGDVGDSNNPRHRL